MSEALAIETPQRNRAQVIRDSVVIRLATNAAGPEIAEVLKENGIELPGVTWDSVAPYWLIATVDDHVIGCCQVLFSKPVGAIEFLFVKPSAKFKLRAIAMRKLIYQGLNTLHGYGCTYAVGNVDVRNRKFTGIVEKIASKTLTRDLYVKRLT